MSRQVTFSVVGDGWTDRVLAPIVQWAIHRLDPQVDILEPEFTKRRGPLADFLSSYHRGSMLVFAHRDSESASYDERFVEFRRLDRNDVVPVIPVRMTEAWLLIDGSAIARAAGRTSEVVEVPPVHTLEQIADPKRELERNQSGGWGG